jgi:hypothetical protein
VKKNVNGQTFLRYSPEGNSQTMSDEPFVEMLLNYGTQVMASINRINIENNFCQLMKIINLPKIIDKRGNLSYIESDLVLASHKYNEADYIRSYDEFIKYKNETNSSFG